MKKLILVIASTFALALSAYAGGWSHGQYSAGDYTAFVTAPSAAHVEQVFQAFGQSTVLNHGPLGAFQITGGSQQDYQGNVAAGTYYIYQAVVTGGYSVTVITW